MTTEIENPRSVTHLVGGGRTFINHPGNLINNNNNNCDPQTQIANILNNNSFEEPNNSYKGETTKSRCVRKPSYVGLSCTVSGYSDFTKYQSPSRKTGGPSAIPVESPPQILDCNDFHLSNMRGPFVNSIKPVREQLDLDGSEASLQVYRHYFRSSQTKHGEPPLDSGLRFFGQQSLREESPSSDTSSSVGSLGSGNGNIVQRQIERLYGRGIQTVRIISPEPKCARGDEKNYESQGEISSKIPAVFKLLSAEFLQQLRNNNCQIINATDSVGSRPKVKRQEVVKTTTLPSDNDENFDISSTRFAPQALFTDTIKSSLSLNSSQLKSLDSVSRVPEVTEHLDSKDMGLIVEKEVKYISDTESTQLGLDECDDPYNPDRFVRSSTSPPGGIRERALLCPIKEEDTELSANNSVPTRLAVSIRDSPTAESERSLPDSMGILELKKPDSAHDGNYFIKILENEIFRFEEKICDFEEDLSNDNNIPEEVRDSILAGIGKAKLLMTKKFMQFRGLCNKNISENSLDDPYVPTSEDLAGFWDMVYIQVEDINSLFAELTELKLNKWQPKVDPVVQIQKVVAKKKAKVVTVSSSGKVSEASKAREVARKKMIEEKKRLMKQNQLESSNDQVEIFVPII